MILAVVIGVIVLCFAVVYGCQRSVIWPGQYRPLRVTDQTPPPDAEVLTLLLDDSGGSSEGEQLPAAGEQLPGAPAWFYEGHGVSAERPGPLVIFAHGNGELISDWSGELRPYLAMGVSVLVPEYRGYGMADGKPSAKAIVGDFVRWYDRMAQRPDVDPARIVFHGRSVGGGVVAELARRRKPDAIILQSTFNSIDAMAWRFYIPSFVIYEKLDVIGVVPTLGVPTLILHGDADTIIPMQHSLRLHDAMAQSTPASVMHIYPWMDHNTPPPSRYWDDIRAFLRDNGVISEGTPEETP